MRSVLATHRPQDQQASSSMFQIYHKILDVQEDFRRDQPKMGRLGALTP